MTSTFRPEIPPACVSGPLDGPPTSWPRAAWDAYREWAGKHEAEGLSPAAASAAAERDVRHWYACGGEAWIRKRSEAP